MQTIQEELNHTLSALKTRRVELESQSALGARVRALLGRAEPTSIEALTKDIVEIERRIVEEKTRPEAEKKRAKRGAELDQAARALDQRVTAWAETGDVLRIEADKLATQIEREFTDVSALGNATMLPPFRSRQVLACLRLWFRDERGTFSERFRRFRGLTR